MSPGPRRNDAWNRRCIPRLAAAVLRVSEWIVPAPRRAVWRAEWTAEMEHDRIGAMRRGEADARTRGRMIRRACGSLSDALRLRMRGWRRNTGFPAARDAARSLRRRPGFALAVIGTLALGMGSTTAIFTIVDGLMLRPLPFRDSERLVSLFGPGDVTVDLDALRAWKTQNRIFTDVRAYVPQSVIVTGVGEATSRVAWRVEPGFLEMLGIVPALGRTLTPDDAVPGGGRVALLAHDVWRTEFGSDPQAVGRTLELDGEPYTIAGVLPPTMRRLPHGAVQLMLPLADPPPADEVAALARLAPGVSVGVAQARADDIAEALESERPRERGWNVVLRTVERRLGDSVTYGFWTLSAAVLCLLLIACANAAGLLFLRGIQRRPEFALRAALGGSRASLVRHVLAESAILALAAGAVGTLLAWGAVQGMLRLLPSRLIRFSYTPVGLDGRVLAFSFCLTAVVALAFGALPAWRTVTSLSARSAGRAATASRAELRLRGVVQVGQIALAVLLLAGAGLFGRSFLTLMSVPLGYEPDRILKLRLVNLEGLRGDAEGSAAFARRLDERLRALPGVTGVARHSGMGLYEGYRFELDDGSVLEAAGGLVPYVATSPDYFDVMGIRIVEGRGFRPGDEAESMRAVVVDRDLATLLWPDRSPVGRTFRFRSEPPLTVVGLADDAKLEGPDEYLGPLMIFYPAERDALRSGAIVIRTEGDPAGLAPAVRTLVRELDPEQPIATLQTGREALGEATADPRFLLVMVTAFATVALLLAAVGICGFVSFGVARRRREIGVRMALGARSVRVVAEVVRSGLALALLGLAFGLGAALLLARLVSSLLFGISPFDPAALAVAASALLVVCAGALIVPAQRAARVDPAEAFRVE